MSQIVFLLGSYYPSFSAVGYCGYQVQKCLAKDVDITVVAFRNDPELPLKELHEGTKILRIETESMKRTNVLRIREGWFTQVWLTALRVGGVLRRLLGPETVNWSLVGAYIEKLSAIHPPPKAIVPLVFPFEAALAALEYKRRNPDVMVIPYLFDDFVDSGTLHVLKIARNIKRSRHLKLEHRLLAESNAILAMHQLRCHMHKYFENTLLEKVTFLEHPLLSRPMTTQRQLDDGVTRLCFTGSLIHQVIEANYLLDLLQAIEPSKPVQANFYAMGNAAGRLRTQVFQNGVELVNNGRVPKALANAALENADILLNIGEVQGKQVSSKVFEYMAMGKPIIHLAYVADDVNISILSKYPLALCLVQKRKHFQENVILFSNFIAKHAGMTISYDQVKLIYPEALPETTADTLRQLLTV